MAISHSQPASTLIGCCVAAAGGASKYLNPNCIIIIVYKDMHSMENAFGNFLDREISCNVVFALFQVTKSLPKFIAPYRMWKIKK